MLRALMLPFAFILLLGVSPAPAQGEPSNLTPEEARLLETLLSDEASRAAILEKLHRLGTAEPESGVEQAPTSLPPTQGQKSFARQVAEFTRAQAEGISNFVRRFIAEVQAIANVDTDQDFDLDAFLERGLGLLLTIFATVALFLTAMRLSRRFHLRLNAVAERSNGITALGLLFASTVLDALCILAAWGGGYLVSILLISTGRMDIIQTLYLNAFLIIELSKVAFRSALSPNSSALRLHPMSDLNAAYWYHWSSRLVSVLGYGSLVLVPIINVNVGFEAGRSVHVLVAFTATIMAILIVLQNRKPIRVKPVSEGGSSERGVGRGASILARFWHVPAIVYIIALFVVWMTRPGEALTYMLPATAKSVAAILLGFVVVTLISRAIAGGLHLSDDLRSRLPLLEGRLNAFVPKVLQIIRLLAIVFVAAALLDAWDIADIGGWIASEVGQAAAAAVVSATSILIVAWVMWLGISSWIEYRLNPNVGRPPSARERTLLQLLRNAVTIALTTIAAMLALSELGVNIGPLLAGAGVLGLAIGFGAQKLVQDVITGVFIQFENAINEGDVITVGGTTGTVERLTIRSVGIRDLSGVYHIVPFSAVDTVSNYMRDFAYHVAAIGVAYREDITEVKEAMKEAFDELRATPEGEPIIADLEIQGVTELADSAVVVRARIKTLPGSQWAIGRAYNEIVKQTFDRRGIEIPFPHRTIYWGEPKAGVAPPLRISTQTGEK